MLTTEFSKEINTNEVLQEYPRPNLVRDSYYNLNGLWNYAFTTDENLPSAWDGKILVPFAPESSLSGVNRKLKPEEYLWYQTSFPTPSDLGDRHLILHFGAVDQQATIFINNVRVISHSGGYLPFSVDITKHLYPDNKKNILHVMVKDVTDTSYHSRGKQKLNPGGMFYTAVSGIWQTVWMECVPQKYIQNLCITPEYDSQTVHLQAVINDTELMISGAPSEVRIYDGETLVASSSFSDDFTCTIRLPHMKSWSPEHPFLYDVSILYGDDYVRSYFAMRKFSTARDKSGTLRLFLNNAPYFHNGLLDQGYWPESLYTPPSDKALIYDIKAAKELGFNMLRKHAKIEPLRWYYHCDRLGMLVWQDMVNGGSSYHMWFVTYFPTVFPALARKVKDNRHYRLLARESVKGREEFIEETKETVQLLSFFACIAMWVPFNEGWGQFDSKKITAMIRKLDSTRTIDSTSGWFDQKTGDMKSHHIYFTPIRFRKSRRTVVLSEFGGYALRIPGHTFSDKTYGYRIYLNKSQLTDAFVKLYEKKIIPGIDHGLSAAVYTQLSDIEEEINGFYTYDRKVLKFEANRVREVNQKLQEYFQDSSTP